MHRGWAGETQQGQLSTSWGHSRDGANYVDPSLIFFPFPYYISYLCAHVCAMVHVGRSEDLWEFVFPFHHMGPPQD